MLRFALLLIACAALAQTPRFDSATITPSAPASGGQVHVQGLTDTAKGTLTYSNITLKELVADAFELREDQIRGPEWLAMQRYDVSATFPPHTRIETIDGMLQALLAEHFRMTMHRESQQSSVYGLRVAPGGPKFTSGQDNAIVNADQTGTHWHVTAECTISHFANFLSRELDRPVIDQTGLTGSYKFMIDWEDGKLGSALEQQLGLRLEPSTGPVEILVVDHAN